jgi:membrane-associated phospholipid phosphatase
MLQNLNYLNAFFRAYPFFICIFLLLFGIIFQSKICIYLFIYLLIIHNIIIKGLKNIFKYVYNNLDIKKLPILGIGERPIGAKYCNCFISEDNLNGYVDSFGMPSGHSIIGMLTSIFISYYILHNYPNNYMRILSLIIVNMLGILVCVSRLWLNCHTIQQIIIGGFIGIISGYNGYRIWLQLNKII